MDGGEKEKYGKREREREWERNSGGKERQLKQFSYKIAH